MDIGGCGIVNGEWSNGMDMEPANASSEFHLGLSELIKKWAHELQKLGGTMPP